MVSEGKKTHKNKGISTIQTEKSTRFSDTESSTTPCGRSLKKVKNEVQTVIELMGPSTPNFDSSSFSYLADNEESFCVNKMLNNELKSETKTEDFSTSSDCLYTDKTMPPQDATLDDDTNISAAAHKDTASADPRMTTPRFICPPPLLPANVVFNNECMCPQMADYIISGAPPHTMTANYIEQEKNRKNMEKTMRPKNMVQSLLKSFRVKSFNTSFKSGKFYKINIKHSSNNQGVPERVVFDLVNSLPENDCPCYETNQHIKANLNGYQKFSTKQEIIPSQNASSIQKDKFLDNPNINVQHKNTFMDTGGATRVDVYYFDHGNSNYLRTTDYPPIVATEAWAEKTERYTTKFWAEIFGSFHIGIAFCTSFLLQFIRFLLYSLFRPLTIGLIQLLSDYFFKPFLATLFNAVIQPPLIFAYNIATSLRDLCDPLAEATGYYLREVAFLIRACRIVEVKKECCGKSACRDSRSGDKCTRA